MTQDHPTRAGVAKGDWTYEEFKRYDSYRQAKRDGKQVPSNWQDYKPREAKSYPSYSRYKKGLCSREEYLRYQAWAKTDRSIPLEDFKHTPSRENSKSIYDNLHILAVRDEDNWIVFENLNQLYEVLEIPEPKRKSVKQRMRRIEDIAHYDGWLFIPLETASYHPSDSFTDIDSMTGSYLEVLAK